MRSPVMSALVLVALASACGDDLPDAGDPEATLGASGGLPLDGTSGGAGESDAGDDTGDDTGEPGEPVDVHAVAGGCFSLRADEASLAAAGDGFAFGGSGAPAAFFLQASDLATYLFYDADGGYLVADDGPLLRQTSLDSDVTLVDDAYVSGAEWELRPAAADPSRYALYHRRSGSFLASDGVGADETTQLPVTLEPATDCAEHPELSLDAVGDVERTTFEDGDLYGIVDTHSHILSNFAFGGGGIFHGAPFHRLGVAHALSDCALYHGEDGRKDFFGFAFDAGGADGVDVGALLPALLEGELPRFNHATAGWPDFTEWPAGPRRSTHQTQYHRWLQRAYLGGLRLVVQHATTNSVICHFMAGQGLQPVRYACDDMVAVDRILEETVAMERYIDAQAGGPGMGWFRIVRTPQQARDVIADGRMAVVLGIETADLFSCSLTPKDGAAECDEAYVLEQLDHYHDLGVRAIFPVHKYDNAFSAGDGDRGFIELGNFANSGHWSNFTLDCPEDIPSVFDNGDVAFGGLNMPRDVYDAPAPNDISEFPTSPLATAFPFLAQIQEPPLVGPYCQNAGLTDLGEFLIDEMMARGMIIEIDHLPQRSYARMFEILEERDYPAAATHGTNFGGRLYAVGGISKLNLGRCREDEPGAMLRSLQDRVALIEANGGYPAEGFGFDLNGFAGAPGPRFGEGVCPIEQTDPITYPFSSYAGDVEFEAPHVGTRELDFNTEGMVHIGLLPELLQDARLDAFSDADLEPLFRSAEAYIRMWERAEQHASRSVEPPRR